MRFPLPQCLWQACLRGMNFRCPVRCLLACAWFVAGASAAIPEAATLMRMVGWPVISPDGRTIVFEWLDDLWSTSVDGGEALRLTEHPAQDTRPRITPDGKRVVFSSNRSGSFQVFSMASSGGEQIQHSHNSEGGLLECLSSDGKRAIISGRREHTGNRATRLLEVDLTRDRRERCLFDAYANSAACSPDGTRILFCRNGELSYRKGDAGSRASQLWLYDVAGNSFERMLPTAMDVRAPVWHRDGEGFYYLASIDGVANLCSYHVASQASTQLSFAKDDGVTMVSVAADESTFILQLGWQLCRFRPATDAAPVPLELWTLAKLPDVSRVTEQVTTTTDAAFPPGADQVVFAALGELWWMASGKNQPIRLTETPAAESEVRISSDGTWLYFLRDDGLEANYFRAKLAHDRLGEVQQLTHGSRSKCRMQASPDGSKIAWVEGTGDVFTASVDGSDTLRIFQCWDKPTFAWSPCGRWLALAANNKNSNRDIWLAAADGSRQPLDLTRSPAFEGSPRWSADGRFLVFTTRHEESNNGTPWRIDFGKGGLAPDLPDDAITRLGELATPLAANDVDPINARDGPPPFPFTITVERLREDVLRLGFRRIWRTLGERFYDPSMHGTDWPALQEKYAALAVTARDYRQFERAVKLMLDKLNASHLGFVGHVWPPPFVAAHPAAATAHPGLVFRDAPGDGPLVIARVIPASPVAQLPDAPMPGEIVTRIAGQDVDTNTPLQQFFDGASERPIPLVLRAADGRQRVLELRCISYAGARALDHQARIRACRMLAGDPPHPRIAWLPFSNMEPETIRQLELEIYRASLDHDGLILDMRDNAGGNAADQVLTMFCQPRHAFTIPRDGPAGYPAGRRGHPVWDQPLVVLCNANTCSNAEIFCHAMQQTGRAPLIGTATAGCVITAVEETIPDVGSLQVPYRGWFNANTGDDLDLHGVIPEHMVALEPAAEAAGLDPQFQRALDVIRNTLADAPESVRAKH
jgi:Tol biopolymer transport system component/C-terminal processing protease CtpA/Prc